MVMLIIGLLLFLVPHSLSIFAPAWKQEKSASLGSLYKGIYSVVSLIGLVMIVYGYSATRYHPVFVWQPPAFMSLVTALFALLAMVLLVATYVPGNKIKSTIGHPMAIAVKVWAFGHLLSNGRLGDMILFASFLAWSIVLYIRLKRRDRLAGVTYPGTENSVIPTAITIVVGIALWVFFVFWLHLRLIGVAPFGA